LEQFQAQVTSCIRAQSYRVIPEKSSITSKDIEDEHTQNADEI